MRLQYQVLIVRNRQNLVHFFVLLALIRSTVISYSLPCCAHWKNISFNVLPHMISRSKNTIMERNPPRQRMKRLSLTIMLLLVHIGYSSKQDVSPLFLDLTGERFSPDDATVRTLLTQASQGSTSAQYYVGLVYLYGLQNVPQDIQQAVSWLRKAALGVRVNLCFSLKYYGKSLEYVWNIMIRERSMCLRSSCARLCFM